MKELIRNIPLEEAKRIFRKYGVHLVSLIFVFALSIIMVYFPVTAYYLQVNDKAVVLFCLLASALFVYLLGLRWWRLICIGSAVCIGAVGFWLRHFLINEAKMIIEVVTQQMQATADSAQTVLLPEDRSVTVTALLLASVCALLFSYVLVRRRSLWWMLAVIAPVCSLSYSLSAPDMWCDLVLVVCAGVLIFTQRARSISAENGSRLSIIMLLPVVALFGLVCALFPQSQYSPDKFPYSMKYDLQKLGEDVLDLFDGEQSTGENEFNRVSGFGSDQTGENEQLNMSELGALRVTASPVMNVYTDEPGGLYLRGTTYSIYKNGVWSSYVLSDVTDLHFMPAGVGGAQSKYISINTLDTHSLLYTPYYVTGVSTAARMYGDAYLANVDNSTQYSIEYSDTAHVLSDDAYAGFASMVCTSVDPQLQEAMLELARSEGITSLGRSQIPQAVREYVSNAAVYDVSVSCPPEGTEPVVWFLTEGKRGYCVHFASACAIMLRSLGVPARVVSGYYITAQQGWNSVRENNAHAWTEYYDNSLGWIPLDATGRPEEQEDASATQQPVIEQEEPEAVLPSEPPEAYSDAQPRGVERTGKDSQQSYVQQTQQEPEQVQPEEGKSAAGPLIFIVLSFVLLSVCVILAPILTDRIRKEKMRRGDPADRAIACWKYIKRLNKARGTQPSDRALAIVLKAQFGKDAASPQELEWMYDHAVECADDLYKSLPPNKRLVCRYIYFLY